MKKKIVFTITLLILFVGAIILIFPHYKVWKEERQVRNRYEQWSSDIYTKMEEDSGFAFFSNFIWEKESTSDIIGFGLLVDENGNVYSESLFKEMSHECDLGIKIDLDSIVYTEEPNCMMAADFTQHTENGGSLVYATFRIVSDGEEDLFVLNIVDEISDGQKETITDQDSGAVLFQ